MSEDPETELRELWRSQGVSEEEIEACLSGIKKQAQRGSFVGPFQIAFKVGDPVWFYGRAGEIIEIYAEGQTTHTYHIKLDGGVMLADGRNLKLREAEATPAGEQALLGVVAPITPKDRLSARQNAALSGAGLPCDIGLFDDTSRQQKDLFEG